jgi:long-chain acyl-CoA synthetase
VSFNLSVIVRESAQSGPDRPAIIHRGGTISHRQLDEWSDRVARGLVRLGVTPGDSVGVQLPNVPEFAAVFYGVLKAGAVAIPMNVLNKGPEIAYFLKNSQANLLISAAGVASEAARGVNEAGAEHLFIVGDAQLPACARRFEELTAGGQEIPAPFVQRQPSDTAVLLYTSGTTGHPKGVQLTHFQLLMNAEAHVEAFEMDRDSVTIAVMPLFHALGLSGLLNATLRAGGAVVLLEKFKPLDVLQAIQDHHATILHGVPTMYHAIEHQPERSDYDVSSLRYCGSAGAPIAAELLDTFEREMGVQILEMYGLTESGPLASYNRPDHRKPYSIGTPIWGTEMQVWDDENTELPAGRDHVGELVIRGHNTMGGYLDNPEATEQAFAGGWLHSGDLGYRDEDGFFFIVDRKKEMIIRGGYNVYPREVEEVLYQHPAIFEAEVVGLPDDRLGEEVGAFVSLKIGASAETEEIIDFVKDRVAAYKYPRTVEILPDLPKSPTGKILKRQLVPGRKA